MTASGPIEITFWHVSPSQSIPIILSLVSTFLVLALALYFKMLQEPFGKMVFIVNFMDFVFACCKLSVFFYSPPNTDYCKILQALSQTSLLSSIIWSMFFSHVFFLVVKYQRKDVCMASFKCYTGISIVFGGGLGISTAFTDFVNYSPDQGTCVHQIWPGKIDITFIVFAVLPIGLCCITGIIFYVLAALVLKKYDAVLQTNRLFLLLIYPAIIFVCWVPPLTINVLESFGISQSQDLGVKVRHLAMLQGFFNALAYGTKMGIIPKCKERCSKKGKKEIVFTCEKNEESDGGYLSEPLTRSTNPRFSLQSVGISTDKSVF